MLCFNNRRIKLNVSLEMSSTGVHLPLFCYFVHIEIIHAGLRCISSLRCQTQKQNNSLTQDRFRDMFPKKVVVVFQTSFSQFVLEAITVDSVNLLESREDIGSALYLSLSVKLQTPSIT